MPFSAFGHTDIGRQRSANEDHFACFHLERQGLAGYHVVAVADGMGGHVGGKVASGLAIGALESVFARTVGDPARQAAASMLREAFEAANQRILEQATQDPNLAEMGTTMVAALVEGSRAVLANLGDSRAYMLRNELIGQVTVDHSWREEARQYDMPLDEIAMSPFRETITRSLGIDKAVGVDLLEIPLEIGDTLMLCSDGLHDLLSDLEIRSVINSADSLEEASRTLVDRANQAGGYDNSTCVLIRYDGPGATSPEIEHANSGALDE